MPQVIERKQQFRAGNDNGIHAIALGDVFGNIRCDEKQALWQGRVTTAELDQDARTHVAVGIFYRAGVEHPQLLCVIADLDADGLRGKRCGKRDL